MPSGVIRFGIIDRDSIHGMQPEIPSNASSQGDSFDVAVIGGGPAGATVATLLAQSGRRVTLIDKAKHPRFHIGESLLPHTLPILERLGVADEVARIGVFKPGAEFIAPGHAERQTYLFRDSMVPVLPHAYQVRRADFDEILFRRAAQANVVLRETCCVTGCSRSAEGWSLKLSDPCGESEIRAKFVVDSSGRDGFLARQFGIRTRDRRHNSAAMFAHYENVSADAWGTPGNISIYWFEHGWIWMIPLPNGITSIGAVCMPDYLKTRKSSLEEFMAATLRLCPKAAKVLDEATRVSPVSGAGNYSYKSECAYGDGYVLVGDAYAFVDPVFSTGVLLAMSGAERAAEAIESALDNPIRATTHLRLYQREIDSAIRRVSWFVVRFNSPVFQYLFMTPRNFFGVKNAVISVLAGDFYRGGILSWQLRLFRLIYAVTRLRRRQADRKLHERIRRLPALSMPENEHS